jgi:hypothetical protein
MHLLIARTHPKTDHVKSQSRPENAGPGLVAAAAAVDKVGNEKVYFLFLDSVLTSSNDIIQNFQRRGIIMSDFL